MRRLLFIILFLFPIVTFSQIVITRYNTTCCFTGGIIGLGGLTYNAGSLIIFFVGTSNAAGTPATISLSGTGQTWTEIGTAGGALNSTSGKRVQAFRFAPTSDNSNDVTLTISGTQDGMWIEVFRITGADVTGTNGSNGIVQSATNAQDASANPTITMSALSGGGNAVIAGFINTLNPFGGTPESGWGEQDDNGFATPDCGVYIMSRLTTTDNTPTVTASASDWAGLAIEIKSAFRRIIITN